MAEATRSQRARAYLRRVDAADCSEFLQLMRNSRHLHQPWISPPLTDLAFQQYLSRTARDDHDGLLVCQREDDRIVGVININNMVRGSFLSASLGYYVGAPYAGKGLMREGLELVKLFAFGDLGLHRLEANIQPDNVRSIALVQQCGFHNEGMSRDFLFINGRWRDHQRWTVIDPRKRLRD